MLDELCVGDGTSVALEEESSYFQTTISRGKRDMQEETKRAVDIAFGVGLFGGAVNGAAAGVAAPSLPLLGLKFGLP